MFMARTSRFKEAARVNILIEAQIHRLGKAKASALGIRGGFSEYVSLLIAQDRKRKGRALLSAMGRAGA